MDLKVWRDHLGGEAERLRKEEGALQAQIDQLTARQQKLIAEREVVERWQRDPPNFISQITHQDETSSRPSTLPSPMEGVDLLIEAEPGIERSEVLDRLEHKVDSDSPNVRSVLSGAISRRIAQEKIWQSEGGRLWPWDHADAVFQRNHAQGAPLTDLAESEAMV